MISTNYKRFKVTSDHNQKLTLEKHKHILIFEAVMMIILNGIIIYQLKILESENHIKVLLMFIIASFTFNLLRVGNKIIHGEKFVFDLKNQIFSSGKLQFSFQDIVQIHIHSDEGTHTLNIETRDDEIKVDANGNKRELSRLGQEIATLMNKEFIVDIDRHIRETEEEENLDHLIIQFEKKFKNKDIKKLKEIAHSKSYADYARKAAQNLIEKNETV